MSRSYAIQWHVERIADMVAGITCADEEVLDAPKIESNATRFKPESILFFDITGRRSFRAQIDDDGPEILVTFSEKMRRAKVKYGNEPAVSCPADTYDVAMAILGLRDE